tara:strand:+ start:2103 stop:3650 length:1548 start_codon:yes stop_codon:yes gene_type:complete
MSKKVKPISPFKPTVRSNPFNPFSELKGRTNDFFSYRVDIEDESVFIIESLDVSLNGRTGSTKSIILHGDNFNGNFDNLTEEKKEIIKKELLNNSIRDEAYKKRLQKLITEAEENNKGDEFRNALEKNENLQSIIGFENFSDNEIETKKINDQNDLDDKIKEDRAELEKYIDKTQVKNEVLSYPPHLTEENRGEDYIFIEQFEYAPPQPEITNTLGEVLGKGIKRSSNIKTTGLEEMRGSCRLPIPNNLGVSNGVSWGEARANAVELAGFNQASRTIGGALSGQDNVGKIIRGGVTTGSEIFSQIKDDFKNDGSSDANSATVISAVLARSALSQIGINVDVDQFITRQTGAAINPNLELLFSGPQLRTFSFNFNFAPESKDEAIAVRKIQRWFKQGMLPGRSTVANGSNLFLGSPNIFRIQYKNNERRIKGLNLIKLCALTSCQIDFTPDGTYQSYDDSLAVAMPVRSTMGLTFNELTPIFRDDYINGQSTDPSLMDLGDMIKGEDAINDQDIGF